ncbi:MAG: acetyl-CoA carboxylase carboxyltransferase subunit beta [Ignavibacteriae bacterium]|nr:acetyl-CoA carboxylase carboxyltransferase subunit beta [Ignavibacteriota bacterium]MCB9215914.1 acetyl-CoA carboxylase carboxyltransferase subunit beta [Ignavibacteria bacterium]
MAWWNRTKKNIEDQQQREIPDGLFLKCSGCGYIIYKRELEENLYTCPECGKHARIGSDQYIEFLIDEGTWEETDGEMISVDPLEFVDEQPYTEKLERARKKTGLNDAIRIGTGDVKGRRISLAVMDFSFVGGSMGSVVGEKITRAADRARKERIPLVVITASGGARMMESAISLMQMAKTSVALAQLAEEKIPYITILTHPTTGGVTASFGMVADITLAEPGALIGFAGPRVIEQTIKKRLPDGFQRSEFLQDHGFVDHIVHRKELKDTLARILSLLGSSS